MDTKSIRQFLAVAESLHFGRAAEACHVSPSALSRGIQRLEESLGATLFERSKRNVNLTRSGELFLDYARNALADWDTVRNRMMAESGDLVGEISLYCSVTASYSFLFDLLARVRREHPRIEIKLYTGDPEDAIARVTDGRADIAIAARPRRLQAGLAFRRMAVSPLVFIAAKGRDAPANNGEWSRCPMILNERGLARERVDRWFRARGVLPTVYAQVAGNEAIVSMVSLGFGVGVVPKIVLENSPLADRVHILPVRPDLAPYEVGLVALERKRSSPLVEAFWKTVNMDEPNEQPEKHH
jgi:LysR family positive regulator for ilvC